MRLNILLCLLFFLPILTFGQTPVRCGAPARETIETNPQAAKQMAAFDAYLAQYIAAHPELAVQKTDAEPLKTKYVIPTVVHVVWGNDPLGKDSIPVAQVESAFLPLFNDYRRKPGTTGYGGTGVDMQIEFSLATIDPDGNPTSGVHYVYNPQLSKLDMGAEDDALKEIFWPKHNYFNVYLTNDIDNGTILGYATFPFFGESTDGVVIRRKVWGVIGDRENPYDLNRTASHEFGHWVSLFHPFDSGCGSSNCQGSGDNICDTPPQKDQVFSMAFERLNSCTNEAVDRPDNLRNYMDYLNDAGLNFFTPNQKTRAFAALNNPTYQHRYNLWQDANLQATGTGPYKAPVADLIATNLTPCVGSPVRFIEFSMGQPNEFQWSFPGGSPATSTEPHPTVTYAAKGKYSATLIVKNKSGIYDTITRPDYIEVHDTLVNLPLLENFTATKFPPEGWIVFDPDNVQIAPGINNPLRVNWGRFAGGKCARLRLNQSSDYGQRDGLILPSIDLSAETHATLSYDLSYVPYFFEDATATPRSFPLSYNDTLEILVSTDCGDTWKSIYYKGGAELSTGAEYVADQINQPTADQWRRDSISLDEFVGQSNVRVKIEGISGFGNNLFLDSVAVTNYQLKKDTIVARTPKIDGLQNLTLSPNPTNDRLEVCLTFSKPSAMSCELIDAQGRIVFRQPNSNLPAGEERFTISLDELPAGVYALRAAINGQQLVKKVVKI